MASRKRTRVAESAGAGTGPTGGAIVTPGDALGSTEEYEAGPGAYDDGDGFVRASMVGTVSRQAGGSRVLTVEARGRAPSLMPSVGEVVLCRVVRITPRLANVDVVCTAGGAAVLQEPASGLIRKEDVRPFDKDAVEMFKCVRPGDVVRARVLSLGDSRSYYLSTAENELGVIFARSGAGKTMVPLTFAEMQCPQTGLKEHRKVARLDW